MMYKLDQLIKSAKDIRLKDDEKAAIRRSVLNFISQNPVRRTAQPRLNHWSNVFLTKLNFVPSMAILLILMVLVGGGVSVGAEKALPGDALYPVKVGLNEEVRSWLSVSEESKANWDIERAQRRLEEAEQLAVQGHLDSETRMQIEKRFDVHAEKIKERIEKFENQQNFRAAAEVNSNFETTLKVHERILISLVEEEDSEDDEIAAEALPLASKVALKADVVAKDRSEMNAKVLNQINHKAKSAAEGKLKSAEHKIAEVSELMNKAAFTVGAEAAAEAQARIDTAKKLVADGKVKIEAGAHSEAFLIFQKAHQVAQEAKLLLKAREKFEIDIDLGKIIKSFEDCALYYPVMESYPRQCRIPDGNLFVEEVDDWQDIKIYNLSPSLGPVGTKVTVKGFFGVYSRPLSVLGSAKLHEKPDYSGEYYIKFGEGYITDIHHIDNKTLVFVVPELLNVCPPGAVCVRGLAEVKPGRHKVAITTSYGITNVMVFTVTEGSKPGQ